MSKISSFEQFSFDGVSDNFYSSNSYGSEEERKVRIHTCMNGNKGEGEIRDSDSLSSDIGFFEDNTADDGLSYAKTQQKHQRKWPSDFGILDGLYLDVVSPPFQSCHEGITELSSILNEESQLAGKNEKPPSAVPFPSLGILKNFGSGFRRLNGEKMKLPSSYTEYKIPKTGGQKLSTGDILRLAGEKFIQSSSQKVDDLSVLSHPFGTSFLGLSEDEKIDVELVQNLLASAEKVGQQKYVLARKIISLCEDSSLRTGNSVERLVHYFSEALREKIDLETGRITAKGFEKKQLLEIDEAMMSPNPTIITLLKQMPYCQISTYTAVQAIIESVAEAKKVHLVDLEIRSGLQCTILMQALACRSEVPIELLRITAVGTKSKAKIEKTGEWLICFAQSLNLPFSFNVVMVSDVLDLKEDFFEIEDDETVAVYSSFFLRTIIPKPDRLESLMRVLRNINPRIMVLIEVEANHNSPVFVKRFIESLFFFGAYFDCLGDIMDPNDPHRKLTESMYFGQGIRNIVAAEKDERIIRHVNVSVWRAFFARFGVTEEEFSTASLYQASLLVKNFACWSCCSFGMDEKCLTIGWKGTPLISVSAWKFN